MSQQPSIGRIVHYVSRGSADGEFPSVCRAAVVTEVAEFDDQVVALAVLNPTGMFFDLDLRYNEHHQPGTWHWPERVSDAD